MPDAPPALLNRPELCEQSAFYLQCFNDMHFARANGFAGINPITVADMLAYCEMFEIDEREQFFYNIRAADQVFMNWASEKKT